MNVNRSLRVSYEEFMNLQDKEPCLTVVDQCQGINVICACIQNVIYYYTKQPCKANAVLKYNSDCRRAAYHNTLDQIIREINEEGLLKVLNTWTEDDMKTAICTYDAYGRRILVENYGLRNPPCRAVSDLGREAFWNVEFCMVKKDQLKAVLEYIMCMPTEDITYDAILKRIDSPVGTAIFLLLEALNGVTYFNGTKAPEDLINEVKKEKEGSENK